MQELEALIPHAKELYDTLGKPVVDRLFKVLRHYGSDLAKYPMRMIERKDAEATAESKARINEIERKDAEATAESEARINEIERKDAEDDAISKIRFELIQSIPQFLPENTTVEQEFIKQVLSQSIGWSFEDVTNVNKIVGDATENLLNNPPEEDVNTDQSTADISKDWLNEFRSVACKKSEEDAQKLFSKVLAGEIRKPGSFSLKTLTTLADMDQKVAIYFKTFCSLCLINLDNPNMYHNTQSKAHFKIKDARIPIIKDHLYDLPEIGPPHSDHILKNIEDSKTIYLMYGLTFEQFKLLLEYELIIDHTSMEYSTFWYDNDIWTFLAQQVSMSSPYENQTYIRLTGYALTNVGKELFKIVEFNTPPGYWDRISNFLKKFYEVYLYKYPKVQNKVSSVQEIPSSDVSSAVSAAVPTPPNTDKT